MVGIRPALNADASRVAAIWHAGWREAHLDRVPDMLVRVRTRESFNTRAVDRVSDTTVAEIGGDVVGFVMVNADEVDQLYVASTHRGVGVAARLLSAAEAQISEGGYDEAWLAVVPDNVRARRFYERQGWSDAGWFEHDAPGPAGPIPVPCHRYVKSLHPAADG